MSFGEFFKEKRIALGITLRNFCREHGLDPGNISRLERGRLRAPQKRETLERYAKCLSIERGSDDWYEFFDLAAVERERIPEDLLSDEDVVDKLPILFRTLRGQQVSEDKLEQLVRMIRET